MLIEILGLLLMSSVFFFMGFMVGYIKGREE